MRRAFVLAMAMIAGGLLTACSTPAPTTTPTTTRTGAAPADASAETDVATLRRTFSPCPEGLADDRGDAFGLLAAVARWVRVESVTWAQPERSSTEDLVGEASLQTVGGAQTVSMHRSFMPGIDWTLKHGGVVDLGLTTPGDHRPDVLVLVAVATTRAGVVFFAGQCQEAALRGPLTLRFGAGLNAALAGLSGEPVDAVRRRLGPTTPRPSTTSAATRVLAPGAAPAELLASLHPFGVDLVLARPLGPDRTVCTRIAAGWNDCVSADGEVSGYLDDSGRLEVWLLDGDADATRPLRRLGVVTLRPGTTSVRLRVQVGDAGAGGDAADAVRVLSSRP